MSMEMAARQDGDAVVVLITGGSGFIGQHIIKLLLEEKDALGIREIRSVDVRPYANTIGHAESAALHTYVADICDAQAVAPYFDDVDCVFHCAAVVSIQYPPDYDQLQRINIDGTRNVVDLCVERRVRHLVYTSCGSVCLVPFKGRSTFTLVINQTESKAATPHFDAQRTDAFERQFLLPGYSASKLRAEALVLNSNGTPLSGDNGCLWTAAIRPSLVYGEGDRHFMPAVLRYVARHGNRYPRIAGSGGKQQLAYAGNVAWGHLCAYKTLRATPTAIGGLPVFITDDTPINDVSRFVQKIALAGGKFEITQTWWYLPHFVFYALAVAIEAVVRVVHRLAGGPRLSHSLSAIAAFTASVLMFNRLRAAIHMDYVPRSDSVTSMRNSANWYAQWWEENITKTKSIRN